ncbi:MAG: ABC transporter ATP-binding protein [Culicoidibacterales bacterium]
MVKIYCKNIEKKIIPKKKNGAEIPILTDVNLEIEAGEVVAIMGKSGSGKTTMLNIIGGIEAPTNGVYELDGRSIFSYNTDKKKAEFRNKKVGFIVQQFALIAEFTALENIEIPLVYAGVKPKIRKQRVIEILTQMNCLELIDKNVDTLSGGQKQRVAIARALVNNPGILLADEPTGALDVKTSQEMMNLLQRINQEMGMTILIVTHDPLVAKACMRVVEIVDGVIKNQRSDVS